MFNWILNTIGIISFFIRRYAKRRNKTVQGSFKFWFKDNWPELTQTMLLNIALMLIINMKSVVFNLDKFFEEKLPAGIGISIDADVAKAIVSFALGFLITGIIYEMYASKKKK